MRKSLLAAGFMALAALPVAAERVTTPVFETVGPVVPKTVKRPAILILSKANDWRHDSMPATAKAVTDIAIRRGWVVYETSNAAIFNAHDMKRFNVVVLNHSTGELFTPEQKVVFQAWLESGGRIVALHGAGGTSRHPWPWYIDNVIGAGFGGHPQIQDGVVHIENPAHPAMKKLPVNWTRNEEWYSFDRNPRGPGVHVLATVDETTYDPGDKRRMGKDHPIIWTKCAGKGGIFFTALGHQIQDWSDPVFLTHIEGALEWAKNKKAKIC
ncbi:ThuA domain-containing protein [Asticcacaulis sp. BYS171W]|uniref:ThuA domain-containing protein n=1 Tax=Asticcacaulis aquaticus TaxID=2984212 RepID=A0ABT5HPH1_9CAUL|nr:ThuA domain-containing protein [Asticcacaulis aquaticus]MDC7681964.1 ThuA domain-containing protein [Asticcacaulis aquaticus]